ncbi:MAG: sensor histidine kinase [Candidatus Limisoma sp.]|nr:ATP-binding protein [bacterium]MDY5827538.1 ATP-binding protein [Candidatus Limisoma sp.]
MKFNIYDKRKLWKWIFLFLSVVLVGFFLIVSNNLVNDLAKQERERMEIWANATKALATAPMSTDDNGMAMQSGDIDFYLGIIEKNDNIPVLLVDEDNNILMHRNFDLPEPVDTLNPMTLSPANETFLQDKLSHLRNSRNHILIKIDDQITQHLYYEDSTLLTSMSYYPRIQLLVMILFVALVYFAVMTIKKAEQNKVWVGLSKETAHQLGTPISSLMAWVQMLEASGIDKEIVDDMNKDVNRLSMIADRFSKIGSKPEMALQPICDVVTKSLDYLRARISTAVSLSTDLPQNEHNVMLCRPLFEWVMENLCKNAVDAMQGKGSLNVLVGYDKKTAFIEVTDTGKGIARKNFSNVFSPGYTTKKRGWGLGLTLAKRIVEEYHGGRIFVKQSEIGVGTTFRIELPIEG